MLMAWNEGNKEQYILPQNVPANEFLNFEGKKFSKSRNWGIDVIDFLKIFPADPLRYTLSANLPETRDTDFYWKEFQSRNNSELADILGNFINRSLTFVHKHFDGKVPPKGKLDRIDIGMQTMLEEAPQKIAALFDKYKIKDGVFEAMSIARNCNKYFNDSEPWITVKADKEKCGTTLNICLQAIFTLGEIFSPIIPFSSEKIFKMINAKPTLWENAGKENLPENHQLNKTEIVFPKVEDEMIEQQMSKLGNENKMTETEKDESITIDDFFKVQLKVAEIIQAERVEKSEKLMKLRVKLENEERQIIAGIAKHYAPEELLNKKIVVVANLKTAKLMGLESQGMVLAVENESGKLNLLSVDNSVSNGTRAK
jgi:methionyl-tRNA synthetase